MSQYRKAKEELAERMGENLTHRCNVCGDITDWQTASDHGGRCYRCFKVYCTLGTYPPKVDLPAEQQNSPKRWAYALRVRERRGEQLSKVQRDAWREVLGAE